MYIFKNSLKNLMRNKGRNFIILLIALLTLTSVTISFSILTLSNLMIERYKNSFGVQASIVMDWEKLNNELPPTETVNDDGSVTMESNYEIPMPTMEEYARYSDSEYVKETLYHASCAFTSDMLTPVEDNLKQGQEVIDIGGMSLKELMKFFNVSTEEELEQTLGGKEELQKVMDTKRDCIGSLCGFTDVSLLDDFTTGKRKLEEGAFPEQENECIISTAFAEKNNLKVGDKISVSGPSKSADKDKIWLTITGIYGDFFNAVTAAEFGMLYDDVFVSYDTLMNSGFHYIDILDAVFILNNPDAAELFAQELYEKGLNQYQTLSYSTEDYENNTKPLKNISHIVEIFALSVSVIGAAIVFLISLINVRERKYEIGVLRAMGMKKAGVAKGMVFETLIIMFICFIFSLMAGTFFTKPIAVSLCSDLAGVHTVLPASSVLLSALMAFLLSVVSGICAVFAVMRHEPMKILSERI